MSVPIYVNHKTRGRVLVAIVRGDTVYKTIKSPDWELRTPPGLAMDISSIDDAVAAGASYVCMTCPYKDGRKVFWAKLSMLRIPITNRSGHNYQRGLAWPDWKESKEAAAAHEISARAARESARRPTPPPDPQGQLAI